MVKVGGKLQILLPLLGFIFFTAFHLLKSDKSGAAQDVNSFLEQRLGELAEQFDTDGDGRLTEEELLEWYHVVDVEDKARELQEYWEGCEKDGDGRVSLQEYLNYMAFLKDEPGFILQAQTRFSAADRDTSAALNREEFALFLFPELSPDMNQLLYREEMQDRDSDGDGKLTLSEYLGLDEEELEDRSDERAIKQNIRYFRDYVDSNGDDVLSPSEILAWVSDSRRHLRDKVRDLVKKWDKNRNAVLDVQTEVIDNLNHFKEHELTQYGDMLFYRDEL